MLTEADRKEISRAITEELEGKVIAARIGQWPALSVDGHPRGGC